MIILREGDRGPHVRRLQALLDSALRGSPHVEPDGEFGPLTTTALRKFQRLHGLEPDGIVGPRTWTALGMGMAARPTPAPAAGEPAWMAVARGELGISENALPRQHERRILEYHATTTLAARRDEVAWCSSFVNWVLEQAGHRGTRNALARSWLDWGQALPGPRQGAITVIKRKGRSSDRSTGSTTGFHVAFLALSSTTHLRLLGGNQSDSVRYSSFPLSQWELRGYRWPA